MLNAPSVSLVMFAPHQDWKISRRTLPNRNPSSARLQNQYVCISHFNLFQGTRVTDQFCLPCKYLLPPSLGSPQIILFYTKIIKDKVQVNGAFYDDL